VQEGSAAEVTCKGWKESPGNSGYLIQQWYNSGMTAQIPGLTPEMAEAARDVLALVRAEMTGDREATAVIIGPLDANHAKMLLILTASLTARVLKSRGGDDIEEYLASFARTHLT